MKIIAARGLQLWHFCQNYLNTLPLALLLTSCAQPQSALPPAASTLSGSYVVLLPDADGKVGRAVFTALDGRQTHLSVAHTGARLQAGSEAQPIAPEKFQQDFGAALAAAPKPPRAFLLYFVAGGARLVPESEAMLALIKEEIAARPAPDLSIIGHTDTVGEAAANERLGLERARWVAQTLLGAASDPIKPVVIESHGEKNLLVATPDNMPEPRNRRVEVTVR
jgi:peptidoglycan-associated lipoprotein